MQFKKAAALCAVAALLCAPGFAATQALVRQMSFAELCDNADKIFRAKVMTTSVGTVQVGGAELPTVTYGLEVVESFKGSYGLTKGDTTYVEVTMLGTLKPGGINAAGKVSTLPELPRLQAGEEYLLMTTAPSAIGLSTTVGLTQGCYHINAKTEMASNGAGMAGVAYSALADELRSALGQ